MNKNRTKPGGDSICKTDVLKSKMLPLSISSVIFLKGVLS